MKILNNSETCSESRINFKFRLPFAPIGLFSPVYVHGRLSEQPLDSQRGVTVQAAIGKLEEGFWKDFYITVSK
jgi:hypothetical protein